MVRDALLRMVDPDVRVWVHREFFLPVPPDRTPASGDQDHDRQEKFHPGTMTELLGPDKPASSTPPPNSRA